MVCLRVVRTRRGPNSDQSATPILFTINADTLILVPGAVKFALRIDYDAIGPLGVKSGRPDPELTRARDPASDPRVV